MLAALQTPHVRVAKVLISQRAQGAPVDAIVQAAQAEAVPVERVKDEMVTAVARNGRHHQGVVADVAAAGLELLGDFLERRAHGRGYRASVLLLDGVHNPANVGMVIRSALAAGLDGVVIPRRGTAELGPLVIKASAGTAFRAPLLRCATAAEGAALLLEGRFTLVGLAARPDEAESLFDAVLSERAAYVLGNEAEGISPAVGALIERWLGIPLGEAVESLNVAMAATLVAYEVRRERSGRRRPRPS
ncbi:MAG: rRNA (guanosine2251-2-O)-methyltransferase [Acidimicrobiia bacterium]|nr:rRNA (guanosine2251-2-O)-methyltransferase [Acidimicrobiia bacterium]